MKSKKLIFGFLGGMGSISSADIFNRLVFKVPSKNDQNYPEIILYNNSNIPDRTKAIFKNNDEIYKYFENSIYYFNKCNVDYFAVLCITAHYFIEKMKIRSPKLINLIDLTMKEIIKRTKVNSKIGILASRGSIKTRIWQNRLIKNNFKPVVLEESEQERLIHKAIYGKNGIKKGNLSKNNKNLVKKAVNILDKLNCDFIISGCTEISIITARLNNKKIIDPVSCLINEVIKLNY